MEFGFFSITLLVIAAGLVLLGLKLLCKSDWFFQFLRGFAGFGSIILASMIILVGLNLASYSQLAVKQDLATVSFVKLDEQSYEATLVNVNSGDEVKFTVEGDLWQVDSLMLKLAVADPFYKLAGIRGRYYSLEQQRNSRDVTFEMPDNSIGIDLGEVFKGKNIGLIATAERKSNFMPMADGAVFSVAIGDFDLVSTPVNEAAKAINNEWR